MCIRDRVLDESYYADTEDMNVSTGALKGMVSALGDGYSADVYKRQAVVTSPSRD